MTRREYFCTRPKLAAMLISAGVRTTKVANPFSEGGQHRKAWYAELNEQSAAIISSYFAGIGKPLPNAVAAYISEVSAQ